MDNILRFEDLTSLPSKLAYYTQEEERYLARGASVAVEAFGPSLVNLLSQLAILIVKPDTIVRRQVELCISVLEKNAFVPVLAVPFFLTVRSVRALYRFQFNAITEGGKALSDQVYTRDSCLLLVLRYTDPLSDRSASRKLARLKGSEPDRPTPNSLRSAIGAISKVFDGVHCADESLDLLREMAVLFDGGQLSHLYVQLANSIRSSEAPDLSEVTEAVYGSAPKHDLNLRRASTRLRAGLDGATRVPRISNVAQQLVAAMERAISTKGGLDWFTFSNGLREIGIDPLDWDALLFASQYVDYEIAGATKLIGSFSEFDR